MSFVLKSSLDGLNVSAAVKLEIPYPSDAGSFKFCIDKAALNADHMFKWEKPLCVDLVITDDQDNHESPAPVLSTDSLMSVQLPPPSGSGSSASPPNSSSSTQTKTKSPTHSSPNPPLWSLLGGAVILVLFLVLGLYRYERKRRQAFHQTPWSENASGAEGLELIESGVAVDEVRV